MEAESANEIIRTKRLTKEAKIKTVQTEILSGD
jgi:hypothetical protein